MFHFTGLATLGTCHQGRIVLVFAAAREAVKRIGVPVFAKWAVILGMGMNASMAAFAYQLGLGPHCHGLTLWRGRVALKGQVRPNWTSAHFGRPGKAGSRINPGPFHQ